MMFRHLIIHLYAIFYAMNVPSTNGGDAMVRLKMDVRDSADVTSACER
jgi:hypothetical protein